jgi:NAD(P)-dependent dehydrogenase (short-subunit alcohol dehydrogenase family)
MADTDIDYAGSLRLDGKGFVLLGAGGGGIGTATARALASAGAEILCVDINRDEAEATAALVNGKAYAADILNREQMQSVFAHAQQLFGPRLSGIIDVVGVVRTKPLEEFDDADVDWQFGIVFRHALLAIQIGAPLLAQNGGGSITLVSSRAGDRVSVNVGLYSAAKAALNQLVRVAALEFGPQQIRVNAVAPGFVTTPRLADSFAQETWDKVAAVNPLRRVATPADVAKAILYLGSDLASYVTGNVIYLDGGTGNAQRLPGADVTLSGLGKSPAA